MARILFSAHDTGGHTVTDYVDAGNAEEALASLAARGLANIRLHDAVEIAAMREDRMAIPPAMRQQQAAFELRLHTEPGIRTFGLELLRRNRIWLGVDGALLLWGLIGGDRVLVVLALGFLAFSFLPPLWQYRHAMRYDRMLRACALGQWDVAANLIGQLARNPRKPLLAFDLAARAACIRAVQGDLQDARSALEAWRPKLDKSPGMVDQRIASVCHAGGDYAGFVAAMRKAFEAAPGNMTHRLDLALAEARVGNPDVVADIMAGLDERKLPSFGRPFVDWARGMVALRHGRPEAVQVLGAATQGFLEYAANPAVWTSLALCSGAYALALAQLGRKQEAEMALHHVWPVLRVHGDTMLLTLLKRELKGALQ
ncbi:hypothetical protein GCM10025771_06210 [Niveibacterium umoris]|uniref:Tetratricopeptide (TPR) repeat protein n=1 Tax=Niveibacterium umoris TaxID=1193620 RepID=A0A840BJW4_9RHOO|nr:hypothetical protein [Niveibacterium umoris]MBB4013831.1 tetratricopeptide (TPR) repeat protein [Niveibacterium umoris]